MSIEEALAANTAALTANTDIIQKMFNAAAAKAADAAGDKPKGARGAKAKNADTTDTAGGDETDTGDTGKITFAALKAKIATWLGEFAKAEDKDNPAGVHPEVTARREALQKAFGSEKIKIAKLPEIEKDQGKMEILDNWLETKAKTVDKGHGVGRFVADPVAEEPAAEDDDMGI